MPVVTKEFKPDNSTDPVDKNQALSDLLTEGGSWFMYDIISIQRVNDPKTPGWQVTYNK